MDNAMKLFQSFICEKCKYNDKCENRKGVVVIARDDTLSYKCSNYVKQVRK